MLGIDAGSINIMSPGMFIFIVISIAMIIAFFKLVVKAPIFYLVVAIFIYLSITYEAKADASYQGTIVSITVGEVLKNKPDNEQYIGSAGGGILGYGIGKIFSSSASYIGAGLGVLIGGQSTNKEQSYTFVIRDNYGNFQTVHQLKNKYPKLVYNIGDKVYVSYYNGEWSVVK